MQIAIIALTNDGSNLAIKIAKQLKADVFIKEKFKKNTKIKTYSIGEDFVSFVGRLFAKYKSLVFIMACGIVVRSIAPYLKDKREDPGVVVLDEKSKFVISLLSGHIGGANDLAIKISKITKSQAVITTATDVNDMVAFDVLAKKNDCDIENFENLKYLNADLVNKKNIELFSEVKIKGDMPSGISLINTLDKDEKNKNSDDLENLIIISNKKKLDSLNQKVVILRPKNLILGIGCKKGVTKDNVLNAVEDFLFINNKSKSSLKCIATIDIKMKEKGIVDFCKENKILLKEISRGEIEKVEKHYKCSNFVKQTIGVGCVAEPCAVLGGEKAKLIFNRRVYGKITLALAQDDEYVFNLS